MLPCVLDEVDSGNENKLGKPYIRSELGFCSKVTSKQTGGSTEKNFTCTYFEVFECNQ